MATTETPPQPAETTPLPAQTPPPPTPAPPTYQQVPQTPYQEQLHWPMDRHTHNQATGVPVWGVLLIILGAVILLGNFGTDVGWIFGLALGAWFVWIGWRPTLKTQPANWWLIGLGLLIGLGSITANFTFVDKLVFPIVLVIVGVGILGEQYLTRQTK